VVLIHICIVIDRTHPSDMLNLNVGGIANQVLLLLASYEKINDIKISLITRFSKYKPNSDRIKIYQIHRFKNFYLDEIYFNLKSFNTIFKIHKNEPIDVLNIHHFTIFHILPLIIRFLYKIPILVKMPTDFSNYIRNISMQKTHRIFLELYSYSWLKFFKKFILKKIDYVRAINADVLDALIKLNYPENRILILPNGISLERYKLIKKTERSHSNYGFVGRLTEIKNLGFILKEFKKYFELYPFDRFYIYGEGPELKSILNFINKYDLNKNIIYKGFQKEKSIIYSNIDVLINASFTEGISNSILEAFSTKTFVIASNVSGNRDLIKSKITGLLFNPYKSGSLLKQLVIYKDNKILIQTVLDNAQNEVLNNYDIDLITQKIYQFLKSEFILQK